MKFFKETSSSQSFNFLGNQMDKKEIKLPQAGDKIWIDNQEAHFIGFGIRSKEYPDAFEPMSSVLAYFKDGRIENRFIDEVSFKKPVKK
jgi:hypothetical protein